MSSLWTLVHLYATSLVDKEVGGPLGHWLLSLLHSPHTHWSWTCGLSREKGSFFAQESVTAVHWRPWIDAIGAAIITWFMSCLPFWGPLVNTILMDPPECSGMVAMASQLLLLGDWSWEMMWSPNSHREQIHRGPGSLLHQLKSTNLSDSHSAGSILLPTRNTGWLLLRLQPRSQYVKGNRCGNQQWFWRILEP